MNQIDITINIKMDISMKLKCTLNRYQNTLTLTLKWDQNGVKIKWDQNDIKMRSKMKWDLTSKIYFKNSIKVRRNPH